MFKRTKKANSVVGLDITAGGIAAAEVRGNGSAPVGRVGVASLDSGVIDEGDVLDPKALAAALRSVFAENKLPSAVRLGIANQRVVMRTMRLPLIENKAEIDAAVRFQAQDEMSMPLDQAVLDYQVVDRSVDAEGAPRMVVVVVAARRDMLGRFLEAVNGAGLRPVGFDLSAFGLIRALAEEATAGANGEGAEAAEPRATLFCNFGDVTNLAVARGSACLFTRVSPFGVDEVASTLASDHSMPLEHARRWLTYVGLESALEELEGEEEIVAQTRDALEAGAARLIDELRLSLDYYGAQEGVPAVEDVFVCGPGSTVPGLAERLQEGLGLGVRHGRPAALSHLDDELAARLTLSYGLGREE